MYEIELKYKILDVSKSLEQLVTMGASEQPAESHEDTYYRHPCRDFASTGEALRIRRCDGQPFVTYKGAKQILSSGDVDGIKVRQELEWALSPGDSTGMNTDKLLQALGFSIVACVKKHRRPFTVQLDGVEATVTIDDVAQLGMFAEIEVLCDSDSGSQTSDSPAIAAIGKLAQRLEVGEAEKRSYLRMVLEMGEGG